MPSTKRNGECFKHGKISFAPANLIYSKQLSPDSSYFLLSIGDSKILTMRLPLSSTFPHTAAQIATSATS